ncbi:hypothetical protein [Streptomyces sp. NPDC088766]|uniref:hypothetical protein n=1 Tax=Streptomyces sp. NPDC088766 TaxID=3365893 RepID=UPI00382D7523
MRGVRHLTLGKYYVNNNLRNQVKAVGGQCVWGNSPTGSTVSWGTNHDWADSATGKDHTGPTAPPARTTT